MKTCTLCLETKPESEFRGYRDASRGLRARCRACLRDDYRRKAKPDWTPEQWETYVEDRRSKRSREAEQRHWRNVHIKRRYGITIEEQDRMIVEQDGRCAICRRLLGNQRCVDHDHETSVVRGILCQSCNKGLANFTDDVNSLYRAIDYLNASRIEEHIEESDRRDRNRLEDLALVQSWGGAEMYRERMRMT